MWWYTPSSQAEVGGSLSSRPAWYTTQGKGEREGHRQSERERQTDRGSQSHESMAAAERQSGVIPGALVLGVDLVHTKPAVMHTEHLVLSLNPSVWAAGRPALPVRNQEEASDLYKSQILARVLRGWLEWAILPVPTGTWQLKNQHVFSI